jgi:hypothetical protein
LLRDINPLRQPHIPYQGSAPANSLLTAYQICTQINRPPKALMFFQMESRVMRNRLQVSFWGMHLTAEGIVGIAAALLIVIVVVAASRF